MLVLIFVFKNNDIGKFELGQKPIAKYYGIDRDGNYVIFTNLEDCKVFSSSQNKTAKSDLYTWEIVRTLDEKRLNHHFIQYIFNDTWVKASRYEIKNGQNFKVSSIYDWSNYTFELGFTYSFKENLIVEADSSKSNKLGVFADYVLSKVELEQLKSGKPTGVKRIVNIATRTAIYIEAKYR